MSHIIILLRIISTKKQILTVGESVMLLGIIIGVVVGVNLGLLIFSFFNVNRQ